MRFAQQTTPPRMFRRAAGFHSGRLLQSMSPHYRLLFFLIVTAGFVSAENLLPVADRLAAQNAIFEEQYESDLRNFPERATAFGDYRYNDKLAEYSLAAIAQRQIGR